jgi:hypothetical protein
MSKDRHIVLWGHVAWALLVLWPSFVGQGTFPNSIEPTIIGMPWVYVWFWILGAAWFLMLPSIIRDSRVDASD